MSKINKANTKLDAEFGSLPFDTILEFANKISHQELDQLLTHLAVGEYDPVQKDMAITAVAKNIKVGKTPIKHKLKLIL